MPFDLATFQSKFANGGARSSQFEMFVTWPQIISSGIAAAADFPFLCSVAELPDSQVGEIAIKYFGRTFKYPGDRQFAGLSVTVLNDENFRIRAALETWSAAITSHTTTTSLFDGGLTAGGFATTAEVRQYSRNEGGQGGVPLRAYQFIGLWPTHVHAIPVNWAEEGVETYQVDFAYQWWLPVDGSTGNLVDNTF